MIPQGYVSHKIENRIRVHVPSRRGDSAFFTEVKKVLSRKEGIERVEINKSTGSILILHHSNLDSINQYFQNEKLLNLKKNVPAYQKTKAVLDRDLHVIAMTSAILGFGLIQLFRGVYLPPAYTLFEEAFHIWRRSKACL